jgi:hypothetical protein
MTPQEKAEQMVGKFSILINYDFVTDLKWHDPNSEDRNRRVKKDAKKCALVAVDEILKASPSKPIESDNGSYSSDIIESIEYWQQVKQEIQNL